MRGTNEETLLWKAIQLDQRGEFRWVIFRNSIGIASEWDPKTGRERKMRHGLPNGSPDSVGFFRPNGRFIGMELKTMTGGTSELQRLFLRDIILSGGFGCRVRSVPEARAALEAGYAGAPSWGIEPWEMELVAVNPKSRK